MDGVDYSCSLKNILNLKKNDQSTLIKRSDDPLCEKVNVSTDAMSTP